MQIDLRQSARMVIALVLVTLFFVPTELRAQSHVVSPGDLQKSVNTASQARQQNLETVRAFLSSPTAQKALKSANMDTRQVTTAVSGLNDQDLAKLAARADQAQKDFAAGTLSERDLILIILAIAVLVLIIVAVR
jgi:hypothetical protein